MKIAGAISSTTHFRILSSKSERSRTKTKMETSVASPAPVPKMLRLHHGASVELSRAGSLCSTTSSLQDSNGSFIVRSIVVHFDVVEVDLMFWIVCAFPEHADVENVVNF